MRVEKFTFTNDDLDFEYKKSFTHDKNTENINLIWYDENNIDRTTTDVFQVNSVSGFTICTGGPITGTHDVLLFYDDTLQIQGRRLHELDLITAVPSNYRIAIGAPGQESFDILYSDLITSILGSISGSTAYLQTVNNLYEINANGAGARANARTNIDVYSKAQVYQKTEVYNKNETYTKTEIDGKLVTSYLNLDSSNKNSNISFVNSVINVKFDFSPSTSSKKQYFFNFVFRATNGSSNWQEVCRFDGVPIISTRYFTAHGGGETAPPGTYETTPIKITKTEPTGGCIVYAKAGIAGIDWCFNGSIVLA